MQLCRPCGCSPATSTHRLQGSPRRVQTLHRRLVLASSTSLSPSSTLVKICGITNPEDAKVAARAGADFIGMIMWPKAKRHVSLDTAARIVSAAHEYGAKAVGVFVDEDANTISQARQQAGLDLVQLHGEPCRAALLQLDPAIPVVYVMQATAEGRIVTPRPADLPGGAPGSRPRGVNWLLLDGMQGGGGQALDWTQLKPPGDIASEGWLLAGGLHPGNVAQAVQLMRPSGVDVSSGVCGPDGLLKDHGKVVAFIQAAKSAGS